MSKKLFSMAFLVIPMMVLAVGGCSSNPYSSSQSSPQTPASNTPAAQQSQPAQTATPAPTTAPAQTGNAVTIMNFAFSPADLSVAKGTTVTWTNKDSAPHQIASDTGDAVSFGGSSFSQGQTYSFKFDTAGTFAYHCAIHPSMHGTITVK